MAASTLYDLVKTMSKLFLARGYVTSFGQFGEDAVIQKLLQRSTGTYIDIGAYHPVLYSNTYALYRRGWSGVVIDPNPEHKAAFRVLRPRDTFIQAAVGELGEKTYYQYSDGAFNTLADSEPPLPNGVTLLKQTRTRIVPLRDLIANVGPIDLMTVDVEGMDIEVLKTHDWARSPRVVAVEVHGFEPEVPLESPAYVFLREKGYLLTAMCGATLMFTKKYKRA